MQKFPDPNSSVCYSLRWQFLSCCIPSGPAIWEHHCVSMWHGRRMTFPMHVLLSSSECGSVNYLTFTSHIGILKVFLKLHRFQGGRMTLISKHSSHLNSSLPREYSYVACRLTTLSLPEISANCRLKCEQYSVLRCSRANLYLNLVIVYLIKACTYHVREFWLL